MITIADYEKCIEGFCHIFAKLGESVVAILLYGSVARGRIRPGQSDVLDATIVLADSEIREERRFYPLLDVMLEGCNHLAHSGLPYKHPFHYYTQDEFCNAHDAFYLQTYKVDAFSKVLAGRDVRPTVNTIDADFLLTRGSFFALRAFILQTLTAFLAHSAPTRPDIHQMITAIRRFGLYMPALACFACGVEVDISTALDTAIKLFPGLDEERLRRVCEFRRRAHQNVTMDELRAMAEWTLASAEQLHYSVTDLLKNYGNWQSFLEELVVYE